MTRVLARAVGERAPLFTCTRSRTSDLVCSLVRAYVVHMPYKLEIRIDRRKSLSTTLVLIMLMNLYDL